MSSTSKDTGAGGMTIPADLITGWRSKADLVRRYAPDVAGVFDGCADELERVLAVHRDNVTTVDESEETDTPTSQGDRNRIHPDALYTREEAAAFLRIRRVRSMSDIPEAALPRVRVGAARKQVRYFGRDLLSYATAGTSKGKARRKW